MVKFHPTEAINNPNALGDIFSEMNSELKKRGVPMSHEQTNYSINILLSPPDGTKDMYDKLSKTFPIGGFFNRIDILPIKMTNPAKLWLALMTMEFGIGGMILVGYFVQWQAFSQNVKEITTDFMMERLFPFKIFNEELVHEFWDKQKVHARPDNLVDHHTACASFMPMLQSEPEI